MKVYVSTVVWPSDPKASCPVGIAANYERAVLSCQTYVQEIGDCVFRDEWEETTIPVPTEHGVCWEWHEKKDQEDFYFLIVIMEVEE